MPEYFRLNPLQAGTGPKVLTFPENEIDFPGQISFKTIIEPTPEIQISNEVSNVKSTPSIFNDGRPSVSDPFGVKQMVDGLLGRTFSNTSLLSDTNSETDVRLFLPQSIQIADGATYSNVDLGMLGALAEGGIRAGLGSLGGTSTVKGSINSFIEGFKNPTTANDTARLALTTVSERLTAEGVTGAIKSQTRVTANPNTRALFNSVPLRSFVFSFKMIPQSQRESAIIKNIVKFFRTELYPEEIPVTLGDNVSLSLGFKFPNKFDIMFRYKDIEVATKLKPCYLTNIQTVYNAGNMSMHSDGNFSEVDLVLTFMESRTLSRKDIGRGY
jgi:hypothetical protein